MALRPLAGERGGAENGRGFATAEAAPPAASSGVWNEGNPRAEGSCRPPPHTPRAAPPHSRDARWLPHSRRPAAEGGGVSAAGLAGGAALAPAPARARSASLAGSASPGEGGGGRGAGSRGCERHCDPGCSARRFLHSLRCFTVFPSMP